MADKAAEPASRTPEKSLSEPRWLLKASPMSSRVEMEFRPGRCDHGPEERTLAHGERYRMLPLSEIVSGRAPTALCVVIE